MVPALLMPRHHSCNNVAGRWAGTGLEKEGTESAQRKDRESNFLGHPPEVSLEVRIIVRVVSL